MVNVPKVLNVLLGLVSGLAIVVAVDNYLEPNTPQSHCANIIDKGRIVGQKCTFDSGPLLESVELDADTCFERMVHKYGALYATRACYAESDSVLDPDQIVEKRPL